MIYQCLQLISYQNFGVSLYISKTEYSTQIWSWKPSLVVLSVNHSWKAYSLQDSYLNICGNEDSMRGKSILSQALTKLIFLFQYQYPQTWNPLYFENSARSKLLPYKKFLFRLFPQDPGFCSFQTNAQYPVPRDVVLWAVSNLFMSNEKNMLNVNHTVPVFLECHLSSGMKETFPQTFLLEPFCIMHASVQFKAMSKLIDSVNHLLFIIFWTVAYT